MDEIEGKLIGTKSAALVRAELSSAAPAKSGDPHVRLERIAYRCGRIASAVDTLSGPGALAVRTAARQLLVAIATFEQHQRRMAAEALR